MCTRRIWCYGDNIGGAIKRIIKFSYFGFWSLSLTVYFISIVEWEPAGILPRLSIFAIFFYIHFRYCTCTSWLLSNIWILVCGLSRSLCLQTQHRYSLCLYARIYEEICMSMCFCIFFLLLFQIIFSTDNLFMMSWRRLYFTWFVPASFHPIIIELKGGEMKKIEQKVRGRMYA